ncbi:helix-turn-helix domain-containing protein [Planctellipticum variicoloris]|uniref:helix-turn-helix domain-containing protein n=1 Tax=Planctellipticum variicoloris TaxID=3064265 RepID=UPI0030137026|nr:helix-turn-helix domain-containing protein [Planctomycetaceae bacterium SH412]
METPKSRRPLVKLPQRSSPVVITPAALRPPQEVLVENRLAWSYEDLALMTGLSRPTLRNLVLNHGFPHVRIGHRVLFTPESVRDWFATQVVRLPPGTEAIVDDDADVEADE